MKPKPRGTKYRNLTARAGTIYYQRVVGERRIRLSLETDDWAVAAAARDEMVAEARRLVLGEEPEDES